MAHNRIIFIGTSEFAAQVLEYMIERKFLPCLIITKDSPVSLIAQKLNIEVLKPKKIKDITNEIKDKKPELLILCAYGEKIPKEILDIPDKGCLNLHPSLLPLYRGATPITQAILDDQDKTGVTVILMNEEFDAGSIIKQKEVNIKKNVSWLDLSQELALKGGELLLKVIPLWLEDKIKAIKQDDSKATYTKTMKKQDGLIDWSCSAQEIERKVRALNPWPGTFSFFQDPKTKEKKMIKILEAGIQKQTSDGPFGKIGQVYMATNEELAVQTGQDFLIIKKLQIQGGKPMLTKEFINGNVSFIDTILK